MAAGAFPLSAVAVDKTAANYPSKPVTIINPHGTGGGTDILARAIADKLRQKWNQAVIVENRPGANTAIGIEAASRAPADGYTLAMCTQASHGSNPAVYPKLRYDALGDFVPIVILNDLTLYVLVKSDSPYRTMQDLLDAARKNPGKLTYASIGVGSLHHLAGELLKMRSGVSMLHVPYKATSDMLMAALSGQVDMIFHSTPLPLVENGQVRILGVTTKDRWPISPEYPTLIEQEVPNYEVRGWFAFCARQGTPQPILEKLNRDINETLRDPDILKIIRNNGLRPLGGSLKEAHTLVENEIKFWKDFVNTPGVTLEE